MSPMLAREDQPPHIYVRGDGRLNNNNRIIQSIKFPCLFIFLSLPLYHASHSFVSRRCQKAAERGSRGSRADPEKPIAVPTGPSGANTVSGLQKRLPMSCVSCFRHGSPSSEFRCIIPASRVHNDVFVCEQITQLIF